VKKLRELNNNTLVNREQDYASTLSGGRIGGDVELFS
jgi:chemotaxis protein CheD